MNYSPPLNGKSVTVAVVLLFVAAVLCFVMPGTFGSFGKIPPAVFELAGAAAGVAGIYLVIRYKFTRFTYSIVLRATGGDEEAIRAWENETDVTNIPPSLLDFTVVKSQGKRPGTAECILCLDDLKKVVRFTGKKKLAEATKNEFGSSLLYDYTANMFPPIVTVLIMSEGEKTIAVAVECDEKMTGALSAIASSDKYGKNG